MIHDLENLRPGELPEADVCIVGAGAAGITLAVELARGGKQVILLESGGMQVEPDTQALYRSELSGLPHKGIHEGRHRIHGGSTTQWGGQILELFDDDFRARPWVEGSGWPISRESLRGYYRRALVLEGLREATQNDRDVWREVGLDTSDLGPGLIPFFSRWCREANFARLHGRMLAGSPNLQVYLHANACDLLLAGDGATIAGIRCRTLKGASAVFRARDYVLALGGIETTRLLLQPHAEGRAPWLGNHALGRYFQDHLDAYCAEIEPIDASRFHESFDHVCRRGFRYEPRFRLSTREQEKAQLLNVGGMVFFEDPENSQRHQVWQTLKRAVQQRLRELNASDWRSLAAYAPMLARQMYRYSVQGRSYNPASLVKFRLRVFCEQEPLGESRITLGDDKDALGQFRARLDWRISKRELESIRHFVAVVRDSFAAKGFARITPDADLNEPGAFIPRIMDSYHHMGGARMADSVSTGVVDQDLKVFGTHNLHICSSAVFPASGFSNPTHTLLALAVRMADYLTLKRRAIPEISSAKELEFRGRKILITGATGFIGSRLVTELTAKGAEVVAFVRRSSDISQLDRLGVKYVHGDVLDGASLAAAMEGCDSVVHCAVEGARTAEENRRISVEGTRHVCLAAQKLKLQRVVHLSTISVYGPTPSGVVDETTPKNPQGDAYGEAKLEAEQLALAFAADGLPLTVLQPTVVYGPAWTHWTSSIATQLSDALVILPNNGEGVCNAVYVGDVVNAICCALRARDPLPGPYLISGPAVTWAEYYQAYAAWIPGSAIDGEPLDTMMQNIPRPTITTRIARKLLHAAPLSKIKSKLKTALGTKHRNPPLLDLSARPDLQRRTYPGVDNLRFMAQRSTVSIRKAQDELGFRPQYDLARGMAEVGPWLQTSWRFPR